MEYDLIELFEVCLVFFEYYVVSDGESLGYVFFVLDVGFEDMCLLVEELRLNV